MHNMPDGFGQRPGDREYFDYEDPAFGCNDCLAALYRREAASGRCDNCGSSDLEAI